jgi:hypothetical protein
MTRISFGTYRTGVREPTFRVLAGGGNQAWPTPTPIQRATLARHHRNGPDAARQYMATSFRNSDYWGPNGTPQNQGWADTTLRSYDNYALLTRDDRRRMIATGVQRDLHLPPNILGVWIDVLLLDPTGYVPRIVLWDTNELTMERALLYAAPALLAAEEELGEGRVAEIEIIHARSPVQLVVSAEEARSAVHDMEATVGRILSQQ